MKNHFIERLIDWFNQSNRWKHLIGGFIIGLLSNDWYCVVLAVGCTAAAMEFKDYQWGGKPDIIDFSLTYGGGILGYTIKFLIILCYN